MSADDPRLRDHPGGWMLPNLIPTPGGGPTSTHLARCQACNIERLIVAGHGDSLRLAFEACTDHNNSHHPPAVTEPRQGELF